MSVPALEKAQSKAPSAIKDDFATFISAFKQVNAALKAVDYDVTKLNASTFSLARVSGLQDGIRQHRAIRDAGLPHRHDGYYMTTRSTRRPVGRALVAELETVAGWLRAASRVVVLTGAGHLDRVGHPRLPRAERRVDEEPGGREDRDARSTTCAIPRCAAARGRTASNSEMLDGRAERRAPRARRPRAQGRAALRSSPRTSTGCTTRPGQSPEIVVEIHGNVREAKCMACDWRGPMAETLDRVRAGEADPRCTTAAAS